MTPVTELSDLIQNYLLERPRLSLNAIALRSDVPETSLRRLYKRDLKRMPKNQTVIKILCYLYQTDNLAEIRKQVPENLRNYMNKEFLLEEDSERAPQINLDRFLPDQISYLVFKLASNSSGVKYQEILRMFGEMGIDSITKLEKAAVVKRVDDSYISAFESFRLSDDRFIDNFKAVANYIKTDPEKRQAPNFYYNLSESLNEQGLKKIRDIQIKATRQVLKIMSDKSNHGVIPVFNLIAIDTLN